MLSRIIEYRARLAPHDLAIVQAHRGLTFAGLEREAELLARQLQVRLPTAPGPVAVTLSNGVLHWAVLVAIDRLGRCAISVSNAAEALDVGACAVIGDAATGPGDGPPLIVPDPKWRGEAVLPPAPKATDPRPLRMFTTGCGAFTMSSAQTLARLAQFGPGFAPGARRLLHVSPGIDVLRFHQTIAHWLQEGCVVQLAPGQDWVDALVSEGVDLLIVDPPALRARLDAADGAAPRVRGLTLVAEGPLTQDVADAARRRLSDRVLALHHQPEVGLVALRDHGGTGEAVRAPWFCQSDVVDARGVPRPVGERGWLRHRGGGQPKAYIEGPDATATYLRDGWFHPGESACWSAPGVLAFGRDAPGGGRA